MEFHTLDSQKEKVAARLTNFTIKTLIRMTEMKKSKTLNTSLWIIQALLAAAFGMAGFMKISSPIEQLAQGGTSFVNEYAESTVRLIGICELLGAIGLILPAALRIKPVLTPAAAVGIALLMISATGYHVSHGEPFMASIILFLLAAFVAWGRYRLVPVQPK